MAECPECGAHRLARVAGVVAAAHLQGGRGQIGAPHAYTREDQGHDSTAEPHLGCQRAGARRAARQLKRERVVDEEHSSIRHSLVLRRVDPERNVARFYALMIERDLFGRTVLVRHWGRVGGRGRERTEEYASETEAAAALAKLAAAKRRRGYQDL